MRRFRARTIFLACVLGACGSPPKAPALDEATQRSSERGNSAFLDGRTEDAARAYRRALERGRLMDDAQVIGNAAYNLGVCRLNQGDGAEAALLFDEALYELERADDSLADALLMRAKAAASLGDSAATLTLAERVVSDPRAKAEIHHLAEVEVLRGELMVTAEDWEGAADHLTRAKALAGKSDSPWVGSNILGLEAHLQRGMGHWVDAARSFDEQAVALRSTGRFAQMAGALKNAGRSWSQAGYPCEACERWVRAARSEAAAGQDSLALVTCKEALSVAETCDDQATLERTLRLAARLRPAPVAD